MIEAKRVENLVLHRGEAVAVGSDGQFLPIPENFPHIGITSASNKAATFIY